ncbi:MAG: hypothetical protein JWO42_2488 [Chloroflexi bacterium]|jgi:hypothetical protein|nr:hypothetical protein [Chloroflexota bacterium]
MAKSMYWLLKLRCGSMIPRPVWRLSLALWIGDFRRHAMINIPARH